nr:immunoglobulin heavy chain junction region [Macaca mulatta]
CVRGRRWYYSGSYPQRSLDVW